MIFISNSSTIFAFMITLPIQSLQFNFGQVHSIVPQCFRGVREPSYPPTLIPSNPLYRQYFILDNVLLIKGSRKILLKMWQLYLLIHLKMSNERILTSIFDSFYPRGLEVTEMHYPLSRGYWDTSYVGKSYPLLKLWQFGR